MTSKNKSRKSRRKKKQNEIEYSFYESDETFAFIAGYTSGGVPYGVTWEEMEEIERKEKEKLENKNQCAEDIDLPFY